MSIEEIRNEFGENYDISFDSRRNIVKLEHKQRKMKGYICIKKETAEGPRNKY